MSAVKFSFVSGEPTVEMISLSVMRESLMAATPYTCISSTRPVTVYGIPPVPGLLLLWSAQYARISVPSDAVVYIGQTLRGAPFCWNHAFCTPRSAMLYTSPTLIVMADALLSSSASGMIPLSAAPDNGTAVNRVRADNAPAVTRLKISFIMVCLLIIGIKKAAFQRKGGAR